MHTISKKDMQKFMDAVFPKGWRSSHEFDIYTDLVGVFENDVEYDIESFFSSFVRNIPHAIPERKSYHLNEIVLFKSGNVLAGTKVVRYKEYLEPLFYVSSVMRYSNNSKVLGDIAGRICNDFPLFKLETLGWDKLYIEWYGENYKDWRYRWRTKIKETPHHFTLTDAEHEESDKLYAKYLRIKMGIE